MVTGQMHGVSRALLNFVFGEPTPQVAHAVAQVDTEAAWQEWLRAAASEQAVPGPDEPHPPQAPG